MPRYFEDLQIGDGFETPGRTITEADLVGYGTISGDQDTLDFSAGEPGLAPVVPDLLVMAVTSGLGFRAPAEVPQVLAFMVFDLHPVLPVRVGDTTRPVRIELPGVVQRFEAGHRIRVVAAASDAAYAGNSVAQPVTVMTSSKRPSLLRLPLTGSLQFR